jgi:hypothetical protein
MRSASALFVLFTVFTIAANGATQENKRTGDQYRDFPIAVEGQLSPFGGPLGWAGVALDVALIPQLSLAAGVGAGGFAMQWGAALKPRIPVTPQGAFAFSLGYSRGDYKQFKLDLAGNDGQYLFRDASWINFDVGYEGRFSSHILVRPYAGISQLIASQSPVWHESGSIRPDVMPFSKSSTAARWPQLFYVGIAVGFDIGLPET